MARSCLKGVTSWRMDVTMVDHENRTIKTIRGETQRSQGNKPITETKIPFHGNLPENTSMVCGEMFIREVPVVHHCHHVFDGWAWW